MPLSMINDGEVERLTMPDGGQAFIRAAHQKAAVAFERLYPADARAGRADALSLDCDKL